MAAFDKDVKDIDVVHSNASIFRGIFLNSDYNDIQKQRQFLIDIKDHVTFSPPPTEINSICKSLHLNKAMSMCAFKKALRRYGLKATIENIDALGLDDTKNRSEEEFACSDFCVNSVTLAEWTPSITDFSLSSFALEYLQKIELIMFDDEKLAKSKCHLFFEIYGSHFCHRKFTFGGMFIVGTSCRKTSIHTDETHKKLVSNIFRRILSENTIQEENPEACVHLLFSHEGGDEGQSKTEEIDAWKSSLKANKKSWAVIDESKLACESYVGVWTLVKMQYRHFVNAKKLSVLLSSCWLEKISSVQSFIRTDVEKSKQIIMDILYKLDQEIIAGDCISQKLLAIGRDLLPKFELFENRFGKTFIYKLGLPRNKTFEKLLIRISEQKRDRAFTSLLLKLLSFCETPEPTSSLEQNQKESDAAWLAASKTYFQIGGFNGYLSTREIRSVEELFSIFDTELLSDLADVSFCPVEVLRNVDLATHLDIDIKRTIEKLFKILLAKNEFTQSLLLCVVSLSMGFDLGTQSSTELKNSLLTTGVERTLFVGRKIFQTYKNYESDGNVKRQAWLLVQLIFLCDSEWKRVEKFISLWKNKCCFTDQISKHLEGMSKDKEDKIHKHTNDLISICGLRMFSESTELPHISSFKKEDNSNASTSNKSVLKVLKAIEFEKYFQGNLTLEDVLQIRDTMFDKPKQLSDIPWAILRRIISIDHSFRDNILNEFFKRANDQASKAPSTTEKSKKNRSSKKPSKLHPSDILLVIFLCCDPFLKRLLAQKMFVCKIAIPFIFPDFTNGKTRISLWPMRDIFLEGSPESVVTKNLKSVSFLRIGEVDFQSKSDLINKLIREHDHSTFFHKDCPLGNVKRSVSNGSVEVTWYIPKKTTINCSTTEEMHEQVSGKNEDRKIEEALSIYNLRGDASKYEILVDMLIHLSNIMIVIVNGKHLHGNSEFQSLLKKIHQSSCQVIVITDILFEDNVESDSSTSSDDSDTDKSSEENSLQKEYVNEEQFKTHFNDEMSSKNPIFFCSVKHKNFTEIKEYLTQKIIELCLCVESKACLEEQILTLPSPCLTDEENHQYNMGRILANDVFTDLQIIAQSQKEKIHAKSFVLPLQCGKLWPLWSQLQKEENRIGKKGKYDTDEKNQHHMRNIRAWQVISFGRKADMFSKFVNTLDKVKGSKEIATFFLTCLKQKLDYQSRTILPTLASELYDKFTKYEKSRSNKTPDDENLQEMREEIYIAEKNLAHASFGLEHFFREMGQVYESFLTFKDETSGKDWNTICHLPQIAAKLLTFGQPLEIMDGDAANIPLVWMKAVFDEISKLFQSEKKLIAISVLGIQSSGKSTLLNTMLGLQFAVSAGRCTRGIYLQLVPVNKEKSTLPFDYALIIDTEGLRAPELAGEKMHHDNELATFVIGLADIAIINIKGETIAEMEDVLQIVVHALIRLKHANEKISLQQTCIFVHQNVSAQNAYKETFQGSQKTVQNLDKMTSEAADEEKMANIKCFKDVIQFDPIHHIFQIPDLWHGSPPMAPASKDYSEKAVEVFKSTLFDIARKRLSFMRFTEMNEHLVSLWKSILSEDFVFSFRNILEIKAYNMLEKKFQSLCWSLEELKLKYLQEHIKPEIGNCTCQEEINKQVSKLKADFQESLSKETSNCLNELGTFFKNADLSEYMVHWKGRKENELMSTSQDIANDINQKINLEAENCTSLLKTKGNLEFVRETLTKEAIELAVNARGDKSCDLVTKFEDHWRKWLDKYAPDNTTQIISGKINQMKSELILVLYEKFATHSALLGTRLHSLDISTLVKHETKLTKTVHISDIKENCISVCGIWNNIKEVLSFSDSKRSAINVIHRIFKKIEDYFKALTNNAEYDHTQFSKALKYIIDDINDHNSNKEDHGFTITPDLEIKIAIRTAGYSYHRFAEMIRKYERTNSIRYKMQDMKKDIIAMFNDVYDAKAAEILATNIVCNALKPIIKERTSRRFTCEVVGNITMGEFQNMKFPLIKQIMIDLANESNFDRFMKYISNSESFVKEWIQDFTIKKYRRKKEGAKDSVFDSSITDIVEHSITEIKKSCSDCLEKSKPFCEWVDQFEKSLKSKGFIVSSKSFETAKKIQVKDFEDFITNIHQKLDSIKMDVKEELQNKGIENYDWGTPSPFTEIMEKLWKCNAECPLCKEPCIVTSPSDPHSCIQHRSQGVSGRIWSRSNKLTYEACSYLITNADYSAHCASWCKCQPKTSTYHPYPDYATYMPKWQIAPSPGCSAPTYWAWFMATFQEELAKHYHKNPTDIPDSFKRITKGDAIASLHVYTDN